MSPVTQRRAQLPCLAFCKAHPPCGPLMGLISWPTCLKQLSCWSRLDPRRGSILVSHCGGSSPRLFIQVPFSTEALSFRGSQLWAEEAEKGQEGPFGVFPDCQGLRSTGTGGLTWELFLQDKNGAKMRVIRVGTRKSQVSVCARAGICGRVWFSG